jgi:phosphoribosylformylglycinamidine synthase I
VSAVRALVLRTAGTNCEAETARAFELAGARPDTLHLHGLLAEPARLDDYGILVFPGGFSYGDDVSAGRIWANELRHALSENLAAFVARGGLVLGVCNGFQVLVETGLLDGSFSGAKERDIALYGNQSGKYECRWVSLQSQKSACAWLVEDELWPCPVAHAEGRFVVKNEAVLANLYKNGQVALRYVTASGGEASYPDCPNGAVDQIAGICDPTGRVLGLMPHPERNLTPWNHPRWTRMGERSEGEGLLFYTRMVEVAQAALSGPTTTETANAR